MDQEYAFKLLERLDDARVGDWVLWMWACGDICACMEWRIGRIYQHGDTGPFNIGRDWSSEMFWEHVDEDYCCIDDALVEARTRGVIWIWEKDSFQRITERVKQHQE
jgi:hypothetical protein